MVHHKYVFMALAAAIAVAGSSQAAFFSVTYAKENCKKGFKWNKKTQKCEEDPGSY
ncbi:MAG: hypothetical protein AAGA76_04820 [Pseudomonadota bacterium]